MSAHPSAPPDRPFAPGPVTLEAPGARLEPLSPRHADDLFAVGRDAVIWSHLSRGPFSSREDARAWIELTTSRPDRWVPFAIIDPRDGHAVGSTRFMAIRREHRGLEIGWTWLATRAQRTAINTTCKLLLLRHAFETLGAIRVEFKTDLRNQQSQRAIERIGGRREGVLRQHMIRPDGSLRDSVYFSILAEEWPAAETRLHALLDR